MATSVTRLKVVDTKPLPLNKESTQSLIDVISDFFRQENYNHGVDKARAHAKEFLKRLPSCERRHERDFLVVFSVLARSSRIEPHAVCRIVLKCFAERERYSVPADLREPIRMYVVSWQYMFDFLEEEKVQRAKDKKLKKRA